MQAIGNGQVATNAAHAVMVLVIRPELEAPGTAALGSGSIVSRRHVLTAAHVVRGNLGGGRNRFVINYFSGTTRRTAESNFAIIHEDNNATNNACDLALILIPSSNPFPLANVIPISLVGEQPSTTYTVAGFGFTSAATIGFASEVLYSTTQLVATGPCQFPDYETTVDHFCAIDSVSTPLGIVCRGDGGAGLYSTQLVDGNNVNTLVKRDFSFLSSIIGFTVNNF